MSRAWHKEKILSPHEESSVRPSDSARISNVDSVMFVDRNVCREMVSFELGKEIKKDVFHLFKSVGQRKNSESP